MEDKLEDMASLPIKGSIRIQETPKYIGSWNIGDVGKEIGYVRIMMTKKPIWFHRVMMKLLLGIWWIDNK